MSATNADDAALQRCRDEKCHYSRSHINLRIDLPTLFHINRYLYGIFMANLLAGIPAQPQPHPPRLIHRILSPVFCALHPQSATPSQNPGGKKVHATLAHHHYVGCGPDGRKGECSAFLEGFGARVKWRGCQIKFPAPIFGDSAPAAGSAICFDNTKTNPQGTGIPSFWVGEIDSWRRMEKGKFPTI